MSSPIPTDEECMKRFKLESKAARQALVHELSKMYLPVMDFFATVGGIVVWIWTRNFTYGALIWLFAEAWRIQINQKKIIDMLTEKNK